MSASCYLCELKYRTIPGIVNGDAVGACKLCGVLACLAHGIRNASRPAYVCGCCVPNLLAVAAVNHLRTGGFPLPDSPPQNRPDEHEPSSDGPSGLSQWALDISNVEDIIGDFADDRWAWMHRDMEYLSALLAKPDALVALQSFARPSADRARTLLAAAAAIATKLDLPSHEMIPVLRQLAQAVRFA